MSTINKFLKEKILKIKQNPPAWFWDIYDEKEAVAAKNIFDRSQLIVLNRIALEAAITEMFHDNEDK